MIDTIWIVSPAGYEHTRALYEVACGFGDAFKAMVVASPIPPNTSKAKTLVFGAHLLTDIEHFPINGVVYQSEQIVDNSRWLTKAYYDILRKYPVWDYSILNISALERHNIKAKHVPIGYSDYLDLRLDNYVPEIDVLFIGSVNDRRDAIITELRNNDINIVSSFNVYGDRRKNLISRAKIVLNMHFYDSCIFEVFRCAPLFASGACVVSEYGLDKALESPYYNMGAFCDYKDIVHACKSLLGNQGARDRIKHDAIEGMRHMLTQEEIIKAVYDN